MKKYNLCWLLFPAAIAVLGVWVALDLDCPIRSLTGIPCPGCGMSRAWLAALRLDFAEAFSLHPMFWCVPVVLLCAARGGKLTGRKKADSVLLTVLLALFILCYILRLAANPGGY